MGSINIKVQPRYLESSFQRLGYVNRQDLINRIAINNGQLRQNPALAATELMDNGLMRRSFDLSMVQNAGNTLDKWRCIGDNLRLRISQEDLGKINANLGPDFGSISKAATAPSNSLFRRSAVAAAYLTLGAGAVYGGADLISNMPDGPFLSAFKHIGIAGLSLGMAAKSVSGKMTPALNKTADLAKNWAFTLGTITASLYAIGGMWGANNNIQTLISNMGPGAQLGLAMGAGLAVFHYIRSSAQEFTKSYGSHLSPGSYKGMKRMTKAFSGALLSEGYYLAIRALLFGSSMLYIGGKAWELSAFALVPPLILLTSLGISFGIMRPKGSVFTKSPDSLEPISNEPLKRFATIWLPFAGIASALTASAMYAVKDPYLAQNLLMSAGCSAYLLAELHSELFSILTNVGNRKLQSMSHRPSVTMKDIEDAARNTRVTYKRSDTGFTESNIGTFFNAINPAPNTTTISFTDRPFLDAAKQSETDNLADREIYVQFLTNIRRRMFEILSRGKGLPTEDVPAKYGVLADNLLEARECLLGDVLNGAYKIVSETFDGRTLSFLDGVSKEDAETLAIELKALTGGSPSKGKDALENSESTIFIRRFLPTISRVLPTLMDHFGEAVSVDSLKQWLDIDDEEAGELCDSLKNNGFINNGKITSKCFDALPFSAHEPVAVEKALRILKAAGKDSIIEREPIDELSIGLYDDLKRALYISDEEKANESKVNAALLFFDFNYDIISRAVRLTSASFDNFEAQYLRKCVARTRETASEMLETARMLQALRDLGQCSEEDLERYWSIWLLNYDPVNSPIIIHARKSIDGDPCEIQKGQGVDSLNEFVGQTYYVFGRKEYGQQPYRTIDMVSGTYTRVNNPSFRYGATPGSEQAAEYIWIRWSHCSTSPEHAAPPSTSREFAYVDNTPSKSEGFKHMNPEAPLTLRIYGRDVSIDDYYYYTGTDADKRPAIKGIISRNNETIDPANHSLSESLEDILPNAEQRTTVIEVLKNNGVIDQDGAVSTRATLMKKGALKNWILAPAGIDLPEETLEALLSRFNRIEHRWLMGSVCLHPHDYTVIVDKNDFMLNPEDVAMQELNRRDPRWFAKISYMIPWSRGRERNGDRVIDASMALKSRSTGRIIPWQFERSILRAIIDKQGLLVSFKMGDDPLPLTAVQVVRKNGRTERLFPVFSGQVGIKYSTLAKLIYEHAGKNRYDGDHSATINLHFSEDGEIEEMEIEKGKIKLNKFCNFSVFDGISPSEGEASVKVLVDFHKKGDFIESMTLVFPDNRRITFGVDSKVEESISGEVPLKSLFPKYLDDLGLPSDGTIELEATDFPNAQGYPWLVQSGDNFMVGTGNRAKWREQIADKEKGRK